MPKRDTYMRRALRLAEQNVAKGGGPFGAVIVKDGKVVGTGVNAVTTAHDPTAHAEIAAIRKACRKLGVFSLAGCEIYASCEPCPMCLAAIYWARLDRVWYATTNTDAARAGFDDKHFYEQLERPPAERDVPVERLEVPGALKPFQAWDENEDRVPY